jgi:ribosome-binding protein aMBF1 (putative translation factor)
MVLRITRERERQELSMSVLAAKAGMHVSSISQIEGNRLTPYPGQVKKLAKALGWKDDPALLFKPMETEE